MAESYNQNAYQRNETKNGGRVEKEQETSKNASKQLMPGRSI